MDERRSKGTLAHLKRDDSSGCQATEQMMKNLPLAYGSMGACPPCGLMVEILKIVNFVILN